MSLDALKSGEDTFNTVFSAENCDCWSRRGWSREERVIRDFEIRFIGDLGP